MARRRLEFAVTIQLVASQVGHNNQTRRQSGGKGTHCRLVDLQYRQLVARDSSSTRGGDQDRCHASRQIRSTGVGQHRSSAALERGDEHLGRGGLAVGSGDHHHTAGNRGHQLVDHQWVEHFSNEPGNGRTAPPDETAQETGEAPDGDGDDQTEHGPTIPAGSKAALPSSGSSRELGPEEIGVQAI